MKNREKYPNTDDAVKAFEEHKKECNCNCTFEDWLDFDEDKTKELVDGLFAASLLGPIGFGLLAGLKRRRDKDAKPKSDGGNDGETKGVECPLCHGKHGHFRSEMFTDFHCPDCDAIICKKTDVKRAPFDSSSLDEFKAWFGKLTSAAKKD